MATLAPILQASPQGESPVASTQSGLGALTEIAGGILNAYSRRGGPSETNLSSQRKQAALESGVQFLSAEFMRADDNDHAGNTTFAQNIRKQAIIEFQQKSGASIEETKQYVGLLTGREFDTVVTTPQEQVYNAFRNSDEFGAFITDARLQNPNLSEGDLESVALRNYQTVQAHAANTSMQNIVWDTQTVHGYQNVIGMFSQSLVGHLRSDPGSASLENLMAARQSWEAAKANPTLLGRPANIKDDQWSQVGSAIASLDKQFDVAEKLLGAPSFQALSQTKQAEIFSGMANYLTDKDDATVADILTAGLLHSGDMSAIAPLLQNSETYASLLKMGSAPSSTVFRQDPMSAFKSAEASVAGMELKDLTVAANTFTTISGNTSMETDRFVEASALGLAALKQMTGEEQQRWLRAGNIDKSFGDGFYENLAKLDAVDPNAAAELRVQAMEVLRQQRTNLSATMLAFEQPNSLFWWDREGGAFAPKSPTEIAKVLQSEINDPLTRSVNYGAKWSDLIQQHYGGDYNAFVSDKGNKMYRGLLAVGEWAGQDYYAAQNIMKYLGTYFSNPAMAEASATAQAWAATDAAYSKLYTNSAEAHPDFTMVPEDIEEVEGTFDITMSNTRGGNVGVSGRTVTAQYMDQYEGGGDYDTLFGHSQRGGQFNGQRVSSMTLRQALDFAKPSGAYGQWVKGQVGRVATPMGRFQFVGTTLRAVAEEMGLDLDRTIFNADTQNKMFQFYANKVVGDRDAAAARTALRRAWEGFKHVPDAELDKVVAEIKSGQPLFGDGALGYTGAAGRETLVGLTGDQLIPERRTLDLSQAGTAVDDSLSSGGGSAGVQSAETPLSESDRSATAPEVARAGQAAETRSASQAFDEAERNAMAARGKRFIEKHFRGALPVDTPQFINEAELQQAITSGEIEQGDLVVLNGEPMVL